MPRVSQETKRFLKRLDYPLLFATLAIIIYSLITISSATHINNAEAESLTFVKRQGLFAVINIGLAAFLLQFDYRGIQQYGQKLYIFNLVMLVAVMAFGTTALGAQRWLALGPIMIQPSEFSKLIIIICMAALLESRFGTLNSLRDLVPIALYIGVPFVLVLKQPDLGTSLVFMAIFFGMVIACGIRWRILVGIILTGIASFPILWNYVLKEYQKTRLYVFIDPNIDPLGSGYHIIQSKIAIGSGMLFGKGIFQGTQSQLNFLPENHTDFIFAVVGEEFGFIGATILLLLYLILMMRGIKIAKEAGDMFGRLLAVGITSMIAFHVLVNVGMTTGIMPVTGIPLPFMSYGVSALTTDILAVAILLNVNMRKNKLSLFT